MKDSSKELLISTIVLFVFSNIVIYFFILEILRTIGFTPENLMIAMGVGLFISIGFGYLIANHAIAFSRSTHGMLRKLTKDILHELNIPVSTIKGNVHLIRRKTEDETTLKRLERIEKASDSLIELYEEMEYIIKKEIKDIDSEDISLDKFIEERIELFEDVSDGIEFIKDLEPTIINIDVQGLKHTIDNLLSNAVKYNKKEGKVTISLKDKKLSITDEGVGIEADKIAYIFNRYYQEDDTKKGEGIGLSLVKSFCDDAKIDIKISTKKDEGTTFILDFTNL